MFWVPANKKPKREDHNNRYIPIFTINDGLKKLGQLGGKPLGDILFEKNLFQKKETMFSKFLYLKNEHWGRKSKYYVNGLPLSVMKFF